MDKMNGSLQRQLNKIGLSKEIESTIFQILFKYVKDMIYIMEVVNGDCYRYFFVNEQGIHVPGLPHDVLNKTIDEVIPVERVDSIKKAYKLAIEKRETLTFSDEFDMQNGMSIMGETIVTPIFDEEEHVRFIVAVTRDVTSSLLERKKLYESEQRYRSIVDHTLDGVLSVDLQGVILETNPAADKLTGYTEKQVTGRSIFDLIVEQDVEIFSNLFNITKEGYPSETLDCRIVHRKGYSVIMHAKTVPIVINLEIVGAQRL